MKIDNMNSIQLDQPSFVGAWYYDQSTLEDGTNYTSLVIQTTYKPDRVEKYLWGMAGFRWEEV